MEGDLEAVSKLWANDLPFGRAAGRPSSEEEVWQRILAHAGHWRLLGYGYWAIVERESGRLVGELGFADWKRPADADLHGMPQCGWTFSPDVRGAGYEIEALSTALVWADEYLVHGTMCILDAADLESVAVSRKAGYREFRSSEGTSCLYRREPLECGKRPSLVTEREVRPDVELAGGHGGILWIPHGRTVVRMPASEIRRVDAEGDYVRLYNAERSFLLRCSLSDLPARIGGDLLRIHRSMLIPAGRIVGLRHAGGGRWFAVTFDDEEHAIGRTYLARVRASLRCSGDQSKLSVDKRGRPVE